MMRREQKEKLKHSEIGTNNGINPSSPEANDGGADLPALIQYWEVQRF